MTSKDFLKILHEDASLISMGFISYVDGMDSFCKNHGVSTQYVGDSLIMLENISFNNLETLADHFSIDSFTYSKRKLDHNISEAVFEGGKTKYIFELWEKIDSSYVKIDSIDHIQFKNNLHEGIVFSDKKSIDIPFFEDIDESYDHPFKRDLLIDGVKESTIKKIRDLIL